jgi:integrase
MSTRRGFGDGSIDQRGPSAWRLRYWVGGERFTKTVKGSKTDAQRALRKVLRSSDTGEHVAPAKLSFSEWAATWQQLRSRSIHRKSQERYEQVLRLHLLPALGARPLQEIKPTEIDQLIIELEAKLAPRSVALVFAVLKSVFSQAVKRDLIARNPLDRVDGPVSADDSEPVGTVLEPAKLNVVVEGFRGRPLFPLVATLAYTGCRRNEALALRWSDLDVKSKKLSIVRSLELSKDGYSFKAPKTERGKRVIVIDDGLLGILLAERERYQRLVAGVADGDDVDLSLIKLPPDALMFPGKPRSGQRFDLAMPRHPEALTRMFMLHAAALGFPIRLHDLRGSHVTALLDAGIPPHVVSKRCGHSVMVMMKAYAQRTQGADERAAAVVAGFSSGVVS